MKPGVAMAEVEKKAKQTIAWGLLKLGLIKEPDQVGRFLPHGVCHHIGLDVHDVGNSNTLQVNMVVTMEPGVYVPADDPTIPEKYRCIGIRIEDDVWIVPEGNRVITAAIPQRDRCDRKNDEAKGAGEHELVAHVSGLCRNPGGLRTFIYGNEILLQPFRAKS